MTPLRVVQPATDLTIDEVAEVLHCSRRTVLRLLAAGAFPSVKIGRRRIITAHDVEGYLDRLRADSTPQHHSRP